MRRRSSLLPATMRSKGISRCARASAAPRSTMENVGSSKRRCWGSVSRNATEFERPVARLRAWAFAEYPVARMASLTRASASGETQCPPLSTRETVPRDTFAAAATSRIVGRLRVLDCFTAGEPTRIRFHLSQVLARLSEVKPGHRAARGEDAILEGNLVRLLVEPDLMALVEECAGDERCRVLGHCKPRRAVSPLL